MSQTSIPLVDLSIQVQEIWDGFQSDFSKLCQSSGFIGGKTVSSFESQFAQFMNVDHCIGVGNGGDALELALRAINVSFGDEVLVPANTFIAYLLVLLGVFISGAGGAMYITCGLGTGPRDGIMLGFLGKSKMPITVVRALIEIVVLLLGYFLGGLVGIGTIIIAVLIGRAFSFWFNFYGKFPPKPINPAT